MALWDKISSRGNVEDRRGVAPLAFGGGGASLLVLGAVLLFNIFGAPVDQSTLEQILGSLPQGSVSQQQPAQFAGEDSYEVFASTVLGSTNDMWKEVFAAQGKTYTEPRLVLFREATRSACGFASSQTGPHYCPLDQTIYMDETFFDELKTRFGGSDGDVAQAYVLAHEAGHHAQNLLGIMQEAQAAGNSNEQSVRLELQADCFAGLWAYSIKDLGVFGEGEIQEAISAAEAVGDDRIQETVEGRVTPENWTHGSSAQRVEWFNRGLESGRIQDCNTF